MGLHQKITSKTESEPCNCGADDDHEDVYDVTPTFVEPAYEDED